MGVEITMPSDESLREQVYAALKAKVDAALSVADQVPSIIKEYAILENQDMDGNQLLKKKPRPPKSPRNFPNVALVQNESPDLMNPARWSNERTGQFEVTVTYDPPEHFWYMIEKAPEAGGRTWLLPNKVNPNAAEEISNEMSRRAEGAE